ncbi:MAG: LysR family transcriptional regulator [Alphaproteobacteria bacterium]|nr:LysR family transcriptional regulator [Alphaproteobacteria bacterium]
MFERRSDLVRLLAVADAQRIVTAADRLAMTQPALSRVIARLEREFGGRLFERVPSGVRPTRLGAVAVERARRILRETDEGEAAVAAELAGHAGRYRVSAAPVWLQAVLVPAMAEFHAAFPEVELTLRSASWREGVRLLADGGSDLHIGGVDTGEALPGFLRRERFIELTAGVAAARDHPLHAARPGPRELAGWPWIDLDGQAPGDGPSLAALLDEIGRRARRRVRPVLRANSTGLLLLATGPWLAWLPLDLLDALPGPPVAPLPLAFGRRRYRTGFVTRRSAEDHAPFRLLQQTVRERALEKSRQPDG